MGYFQWSQNTLTQPPGEVELLESEEEVKKRKPDRKRKRTRKRRKNVQSSSSSGTSSSSSSSDSGSSGESEAEGREKRNKKKDTTQRILAKNADVEVKITSPTKKDIRGGKKSADGDAVKNRKESIPNKRKASKSPENDNAHKEKMEPAGKAKRVNEPHNVVTSNVVTSSVTGSEKGDASGKKESGIVSKTEDPKKGATKLHKKDHHP